MRDQILKGARTLAAFLPMLSLAQPMAAQRERSWEFSVGGGAVYTDGALVTFLGSNGFTTSGSRPTRLMPAAAVRLGYNVTEHWGLSIGTAGATASSMKYLTPFAAATYTANLNARFSPFLTGGTQFTRITGNGRKVHPTWGAHLGVGIRSMIDNRVALRLEGRMGIEHYADLPGAKTAYNSIVTLGLSYFTTGHRAPPAMAAAPCPVCGRARVDTVFIQAPPPPPPPLPPPPPPHKCERGIAPPGAPVDEYGCLVLRDTLLLEGVHFAFNKSSLTPTATPILDRVAETMLAHPEVYFEIAGHTDSVGTFAYNFLLSARRARAVRDYLIQQGVPGYRMTAVGYGEGLPIAPNATVAGRALNRRAAELRVKKP